MQQPPFQVFPIAAGFCTLQVCTPVHGLRPVCLSRGGLPHFCQTPVRRRLASYRRFQQQPRRRISPTATASGGATGPEIERGAPGSNLARLRALQKDLVRRRQKSSNGKEVRPVSDGLDGPRDGVPHAQNGRADVARQRSVGLGMGRGVPEGRPAMEGPRSVPTGASKINRKDNLDFRVRERIADVKDNGPMFATRAARAEASASPVRMRSRSLSSSGYEGSRGRPGDKRDGLKKSVGDGVSVRGDKDVRDCNRNVEGVAGFVSEGSTVEDNGVWVERFDGSLPMVGFQKQKNSAAVGRVHLPTLDEVSGTVRLKGLVRASGSLPRLTASAAAAFSKQSVQKNTNSTAAMRLDSSDREKSPSGNNRRGEGQRAPILDSLNEPQKQAVESEPGRPCLVLAGPGSGKTRVLTHRAAYLVEELGVAPSRIVAVTFTNKAAGEMKERIDALLTGNATVSDSGGMLVGTFHSICGRILRMHGGAIGLASNFDIADETDAREVLKEAVRENIPREFSAELVADFGRWISKLKNEREKELRRYSESNEKQYARLLEMRKIYDLKLRAMNKLDFDDLLLEARRLMTESDDVRQLLQTRYHHVLVDEWQDTNTVQYDIVGHLAASHRNLFVVGDADQSIYKFRGADSRNMGRFSKDFADLQTVQLVENYRSTRCIVDAAQAVIQVNRNRPQKEMMTSNDFGNRIELKTTQSQADEAFFVARRARSLGASADFNGVGDIAVLYRTNAQSRALEEAFVKLGIPYRLYGGVRFYERQEIKDLLAYLRLLRNPLDDTSLKRAINTPPRGIGSKTVERLEQFATERGTSMLAALDMVFAEDSSSLGGPGDDSGASALNGGAKNRLLEFYNVLHELKKYCSDSMEKGDYVVSETLSQLLEITSYKDYISKIGGKAAGSEKAAERWQNVQELLSVASQHSSLDSFVEGVALMSTPDITEDGDDVSAKPQAVTLMTLHGGKGLEFPCVFIIGMEEGQIPMIFGDQDKHEALEEERRLAYVGMTRAKRLLILSWRKRKMILRGKEKPIFIDAKRSRFLDDIPDELLNESETQEYSGGKSKKESFTGWKKKQVSTITSYGNDASVIAPAFEPKPNKSTGACKVGDSVRDPKNGRGVIINIGRGEGQTVEVLFANGTSKWVPRRTVQILFSP